MARPQTLTRTPPDAAQALSVAGRPLPSAHASLASILASRLGQAHRGLLATPTTEPDGGVLWTSPLPGEVQPATALPPEDRSRLDKRAAQLLGDIRGLATQMRAEGATGEVVGTMLELAARHPPGDWLYSVGGKPVLVLWGHDAPGVAQPGAASVPASRSASATGSAPAAGAATASVATQAAPVTAKAAAAGSTAATAARPARRGWIAALALLLAAALLAGWFFGLRGGQAGNDGLDPQLAQAEADTRALEAELARRKAEPPRFICAAPPPAEAPASAPEPPPAASAPPPPAPPSAPASTVAACPGGRPKEQAPQFAIVFDTSPSMNYSLNASKADIERAEQEAALVAPMAALGLYRGPDPLDRVLGEPRRLTPAKSAAAAIAADLPADVGAGLVLVDSCRDGARPVGYFEPGQRAALLSRLRGLSAPRADATTGTPLADGLAKAARMVDGVKRDAVVLVISDGEENCGGDSCATAASIARARPRLRFNVLDITGTGAGNCVARATGGKVYTARNAREITSMMKRATQEAMAPEGCR